jgi:putative transposase
MQASCPPGGSLRRSRHVSPAVSAAWAEVSSSEKDDKRWNFTASFDAVFQATGARIVRTAVPAPRMNAICERLIGTLSRELLDRVPIISEQHLRAVPTEYQAHYNTARPHQGIAQRVPDGEPDAPRGTVTDIDTRQIRRKPVLRGLINEYTHAA